jgi:hypothetical protein
MPFASIVAMAELEEAQVTPVATGCELPSEYMAVAIYRCALEIGSEKLAGVTATPVSVFTFCVSTGDVLPA